MHSPLRWLLRSVLLPMIAFCRFLMLGWWCSSWCRVVDLWTFSIHSGVFVVLVRLMFEQSCWGHLMSLASDIARRQFLSKFPDPLDITSILLPLLLCCLSLGCGSSFFFFLDASIVIELHYSAFWLVVVFCSGHTLYMTFDLLSSFC